MQDDPRFLHCHLCEEDFPVEAFTAHLTLPQHQAELTAVQGDSLDLLLRIHDLLKQLVDKGQQVPSVTTWQPLLVCRDCFFSTAYAAAWTDHQHATQHQLGVAKVEPSR